MTNNNTSVAIETLLYRNGLSEKDIADAFALFSGYDIDYADFYFQRSVSEGYVLEESIVKTGHYNTDMGVGVRAVCGEKSALAYSEEISRESLFEAVRTVRAIAQATDNQVTVNVTPKDGPKVLYRTVDPIEAADTDAKIKLLRSLDAHARSRSPLITQVTTSVGASHDAILIAKMDGTLIGDIRPLVRVNLGVIAEKDGKKEQGQAGGGGRFALDLYNEEVIEQYAREAVDAAVRNLDARPAPAGSIPVVLGNGWPGVLIHEAVGHGLEADFIRKGTSVFTDKVGQRVASPIVTVVDDGTIAGRRGSLTIDDEGNETHCTTLIDEGILRGFMHDETSARLMKQKTTGNGRRESFAYLPMPRMTNTYMLAGQSKFEDLIASVEYGIYAPHFGGGQVDITSGKFVFSTSEAYLIEKGKVTKPVIGATLIGSGIEVMQNISMVADELELDPGIGVCGKEGQSVPVGIGQPALKIDNITVGGTN